MKKIIFFSFVLVSILASCSKSGHFEKGEITEVKESAALGTKIMVSVKIQFPLPTNQKAFVFKIGKGTWDSLKDEYPLGDSIANNEVRYNRLNFFMFND